MSNDGIGTDYRGHVIQAVPLVEGKINLTSGTRVTNGIIHCVEDGDITLEWASGGNFTTLSTVAGEDFAYEGIVTIVSGMYHLS